MLYGAIIGDIAGSKYEFNNIKHKPEKIMDDGCFFTDDTVMTIAIADAINRGEDMALKMREWGNRYPDRGYGGNFALWLIDQNMGAYGSFGNGSAMRVSAAAYISRDMVSVRANAMMTAMPTHNHMEGIRGAQATAAAIYLAKEGADKSRIKKYIVDEFGYNLNRSCDEIRKTYVFNETCQRTVPEAITAFLEADSFEDCIKLSISLGGDSDTLAAIAGSIAEPYFGISESMIKRCRSYLPDDMLNVIDTFDKTCQLISEWVGK